MDPCLYAALDENTRNRYDMLKEREITEQIRQQILKELDYSDNIVRSFFIFLIVAVLIIGFIISIVLVSIDPMIYSCLAFFVLLVLMLIFTIRY